MTRKFQADIPSKLVKEFNFIRKTKKVDRDTLLTIIMYEGIENIKNLNKYEILSRYLDIIEKLEKIHKNA